MEKTRQARQDQFNQQQEQMNKQRELQLQAFQQQQQQQLLLQQVFKRANFILEIFFVL